MASAHDFLRRMEELQAARRKAFAPLAEILAERDDLQQKLAALNEPYVKAYIEAEAAGWTVEELRELGAHEPVRRPKGRSRTRRTAKKAATGTTATAPESSTPTVPVPAQESTGDLLTAAAANVPA